MRRIAAVLVLVVAVLAGAWLLRGWIPGPWQRAPEALTVSPAAAAQAEAKLDRLRQRGDSVHLSSVEFTSFLRYRWRDPLSRRITAPEVRFRGDTIAVTGRVPTASLPDTRDVRSVRDFLPDTADVEVSGRLRPLPGGRAALRIDALSFARVPVPDDLYPSALDRLGRRSEPGLAPNEYAVRLPPGVGAAAVERGELVLWPARATAPRP